MILTRNFKATFDKIHGFYFSKGKKQADEFFTMGWRRWSLHLFGNLIGQSISRKNFDRMRCKTKAFCEDLHKSFNKKIYDMFRTLDN